ncbi:MAG: TAXI family TRAP transporter solute-binding subunit [Hyphomicrobiaceae bacterium]
MRSEKPGGGTGDLLWTGVPVLLVVAAVVAAFWAAFAFIKPQPPNAIVIATASEGSPYWKEAERYRPFLEKNGVKLEQRVTTGSFENLQLLKDPAAGVQVGILQGGISNASEAPGLRSLGRIGYEPVWIFHRGPAVDRLAGLRGKRILIGPAGGGTHFLARRLLAASGVDEKNSTLIAMELPDYVAAFREGQADAGILVLGPDAGTIKRLLEIPGIRLLDLAQAEAYAQRFPYLQALELKQGVLDLARNVPDRDTSMVATMAALVVREDMHPALSNLLTQALIAAHESPVVGPNGEAPVFEAVGQFPNSNDPEFQLSEDARRVYKSGAPFLQRFVPFGWATMIDRLTVLILPLIGVLFPAMKLGPMLYTWRTRRRLLHWYRQLKQVERGVYANPDPDVIVRKQDEIDAIERAVNDIHIPLMFTDQLYHLRNHIDVVRRRLAALAG